MPKREPCSSLRSEIERAIRTGRCAYCRQAASRDQPLTREHVIPRAKGGSRKDVTIIVPACARCNHRRGCRELVLFLLLRPRRISAFLDHLSTLSPDGVRQMDARVFSELYAAVWMLRDSLEQGPEWRSHLKRLCSGRTLHRRRYAARRVMGAVERRLEAQADGREASRGPGSPLPRALAPERVQMDESLERIRARLLGILSLAWGASAEEVQRELTRQHERAAGTGEGDDRIVMLDGWTPRRRRRRLRVDRRGGRGARGSRGAAQAGGRAA